MQEKEEFIYVIFGGALIFFVLVVFIVIAFLTHKAAQRKHQQIIKEKENQFREEILKAQLEVKEQTLRSVSEELHDNIGQVLSLVKLNLATLPNDPQKSEKKLTETQKLVKGLSEDLRHMSRLLHPEHGDFTIADVLRAELDKLEQSGLYQTELMEKGVERKLPPNVHILIYRMIQEILNNVIKHAQATQVVVLLEADETQTKIKITDNGKGFDISQDQTNSMGLKNLEYRASLIGATIDFISQPGAGTTVLLGLVF